MNHRTNDSQIRAKKLDLSVRLKATPETTTSLDADKTRVVVVTTV
jgi:hypothetical protein